MAKGPKPEAEAGSSGVTIADSVIAKIAHKACQEIAGVHALGGATSRALSSLRGGEESHARCERRPARRRVDIDITLVITYGINIPQVAEACRAAVKEQVEGSTGLTVRTINVVIGDVYFPEEPAAGDAAKD